MRQYGLTRRAHQVGNARKVVSLVTSFVVFPKPIVGQYVLGSLLFVVGLVVHTRAEAAKTPHVPAETASQKPTV
jgi:hypothetical protein